MPEEILAFWWTEGRNNATDPSQEAGDGCAQPPCGYPPSLCSAVRDPLRFRSPVAPFRVDTELRVLDVNPLLRLLVREGVRLSGPSNGQPAGNGGKGFELSVASPRIALIDNQASATNVRAAPLLGEGGSPL